MQDGIKDITDSIARYAQQKHFDLIVAVAPLHLSGGAANAPKPADITAGLSKLIAHPPVSPENPAASETAASTLKIASIKNLDWSRIDESRLLLIRE